MKTTREQKLFNAAFNRGAAFWTSEDGTMMSIVIARVPDWQEVLQFEYEHIFAKQPFDETRAKPKFAEREWIGKDWFDGNSGTTRGKIWRTTEEETPYPVFEYELEFPQ